MARINPLPRADWSPEMEAVITDFRANVIGDHPDEGRPSGFNLLGVLARYPALTKSFLGFNGHLLYGSTLSAKLREMIILRVAHLRGADYEWAQHLVLAKVEGTTDEEVARIAEGPDAPGWDPVEAALFRATDDLINDGRIGEAAWGVLREKLSENELLDLVFTVGTYAMVAMVLRTFDVPPDDDILPYLPDRATP